MNSDQAEKIHYTGCVNKVEAAAPPSAPDRPVYAARRNNTLHGPCHKKDCTDKIDTVYSNRGTDGVRTHDLSRVRRTLIPAELPFHILTVHCRTSQMDRPDMNRSNKYYIIQKRESCDSLFRAEDGT